MHRPRLATALLVSTCLASVTTPALADVLLADFAGDDGVFNVTNEVTSTGIANGELTVVTPGGFRNILHDDFLPRTGTSTPNVDLTASDLLANPIVQWDWRSDDAGSTGDFIGNHLVFNTDVTHPGANEYRVLTDSFRFIPPNADTAGTHAYDLRTDSAGLALLQSWVDGAAGNYFQIFVVQQTTENTPQATFQATVHYGEFRVVVPEPAGAGVLLLAAGAVVARRRRPPHR